MVICYPLMNQNDYVELMYSLRSVEKFLSSPYEILLVGNNMPDWITGVTQIELGDIPGKKQLSIRRKILAALEYTKEILFMNDDFFLLEALQEVPFYFNGSLKTYSESGSKTLMKQLEAMNKPIKNFDIHYPIIYDHRFKDISTRFTDDVILKSMYCNFLKIDGIQMDDCKPTGKKLKDVREFIKDKPNFSTGHYSIKQSLPVLQELFPFKSKFEI